MKARGAGAAGTVAAIGLWLGSCGDAPRSESPQDPAADPRLAVLLTPCERAGYYGVDLADVVPVLIGLLVHGDHEPLRRAQTELGRMGATAVPGLRRLIAAYWGESFGSYRIRNALGALTQAEVGEEGVHELLLRCLEHPDDEVKMLVARALQRHGTPADFDPVRAFFDRAPTGLRPELAMLLHRLDPERAVAQYLEWLASAEYPGLRPNVLPLIAASANASALCRALWEKSAQEDVATHLWLSAPLARGGDPEALAELRTRRVDENPALRERALRALIAAGLIDEVAASVRDDPLVSLRTLAARAVDEDGPDDLAHALLSEGAQDPSPDMQFFCLQALARRGDQAAIERGLALMAPSNPLELEHGLRVVSAAWSAEPELARRAFDRLQDAYVAESPGRPLADLVQLLQSIGRVPHPAATALLLERARSAPETLVKGMRPHRWLCLQAGNGGPAAQNALFERLESEQEPLARLDLLEAASAAGGEAARAGLLAFIAGEAASDIELLYAASRLVRLGPAEDVAWRLKRLALRMQDARAQRGLQCLLWSWYPDPG